jgi:hypothetical protein
MADALIVVTEKKEPYWITYIKRRIANKKNFLCLLYGATGSGKSWTALSIAHQLNPDFNPTRIIFGLKGLMELINSSDQFPEGTCFVWDEFQIGAGNREWQSLANKLLNQLLSTFRHKRYILLITCPYADFLDSHARKLLHAEFEITGIDYNESKTKVKPMLLQYNSRMRKWYYKYLRVATGRGASPVKLWRVGKAPKWLIEEYELKKTAFTSKLNKSIEEQLDRLEEKAKPKGKQMTAKQKQVVELMSIYDNAEKVATELNISSNSVYFHLSQARKKGFTPKNNRGESEKNG